MMTQQIPTYPGPRRHEKLAFLNINYHHKNTFLPAHACADSRLTSLPPAFKLSLPIYKTQLDQPVSVNPSVMAALIEEYIFRSQYPPVPVPEDITLPEFVLEGAEDYADKVAFVEAISGKAYTYGQVVRDSKRFAKALRSLGLRKGRAVVVVLPNVAEYGIVALGIMASGGVFSGANPAAHESEIKKQLEVSDAGLIVTDESTCDCNGS